MRRKWWIIGGVAALVVVGMLGGMVWIALWIGDNLDAPGPGPTGSGPCGPADAVNVLLVYADGHTVQACTRDRPACPNYTLNGTANGATAGAARFGLSNQLRSASRRYILSISLDGPLPAEAPPQSIPLSGFVDLPGQIQNTSGNRPVVGRLEITPRDPREDTFTTVSGTLSIASTRGAAQGSLDASFSNGPARPDRPAPSSTSTPPVSITGTFACNR